MKQDNLEIYKADGLIIVDEDGIEIESIEQNELIHQEKYDRNIPHQEELSLDAYFKQLDEEAYWSNPDCYLPYI
jgi:hypothetical protein